MSNHHFKKTVLIVMSLFSITLTMIAQVSLKTPNKEFDSALKLFLDAKDSDNPKLDYRNGLVAMGEILKLTHDNDVKARCHYFRSFSYFILRDYARANQEIERVIELAPNVYSKDVRIRYEEDIVSAVLEDDVALDDALIALTANDMKSAAAFGKSLEKYFNKTTGEVNEELIGKTTVTIVVLSILSPAFCPEQNLAKDKTSQSLCQDNMRSIIKGWRDYIRDHNGKVPPISIKVNNTGSSCHDRAEWPTIIGKYLPDKNLQNCKFDAASSTVKIMPGSIMQCPAAKPWRNGSTSPYVVDYGMNHMADNIKTFKDIENPHELIVFIDSRNSYAGPVWGYNYIQFRHSNGVNVAYADGHVDWKSKAELPNDEKLPIWAPQSSPTHKVCLELENQVIGLPITTQLVVGTIVKPTYISKGKGLTARVEDIPELNGKALVVGDNSELLNQNIAFSIDSVKSGKYEIMFDYFPIKNGNNHIAVFDLRNSVSQKIFKLSMHKNRTDLSIRMNGKEQLFTNVINSDKTTNFNLFVDFDKWDYQLLVNGKKLVNGELGSVNDHNLRGMIFSIPGTSEFAIKNLIANRIK